MRISPMALSWDIAFKLYLSLCSATVSQRVENEERVGGGATGNSLLEHLR